MDARIRDIVRHVVQDYDDEWEDSIRLCPAMWDTYQLMGDGEKEEFVRHVNRTRILPYQFTTDDVKEQTVETMPSFGLTDTGNAKRLLWCAKGNILYCNGREKWLVWNGHHWVFDRSEAVIIMYRDKVIRMLEVDLDFYREMHDTDMASAYTSFIKSSQNTTRINNMVTEARRIDPSIRVSPGDLDDIDATRYLFNCRNATVDLRTGKGVEQKRDDRITKCAPVEYDPEAKCPLWERTLKRIFRFNTDVIPFVQRMLGSALTGDIKDGKFFYFFGEGSNGKGTILRTMLNMLGEDDDDGYGANTQASTFTLSKMEGISNDRAKLRGTRFVAVEEMGDNRHLDMSFIKGITGGDPITARFLREEYFTFMPQFKIFFQGNKKPELGNVNNAIRRRFVYLHFKERIEDDEMDRTLEDRLKGEYPGILNWLVAGCVDWLNPPDGKDRLRIPESVIVETDEYLEDQDPLESFLRQMIARKEDARLPHKRLYGAYREWHRLYCGQDGMLANNRLAQALGEKGYFKTKTNNRTHWCNIEINEQELRNVRYDLAKERGEEPGTLTSTEDLYAMIRPEEMHVVD